MGWKRIIGKLFLIGVGGGCLVLIMYVGLPWLTAQLEVEEPPQPPGPEAILADLLNAPETEEADGDRTALVGEEGAGSLSGTEDSAAPVAPPLVALRNDGEQLPVVFPAAESEGSQDEAIAVADDWAGEEQQDVVVDPAEELPPVLSPEEVAAAMAFAEAGGEEDTGPADTAAAPSEPFIERQGSESELEAEEQFRLTQADKTQPEAVLARGSDAGRYAGIPLPPPSATREVQQFLQASGYDPGPVDGIWGKRTARAWRSYARDTDKPAAGTEIVQSQPEENAEPPSTVSPTPSGETVEPEGPGAGQAGETRHPAGLPSQETAQPVVVPGTLRGVMGYRMPLVSRQGVPDQVVSGVLIPAHTTFVILKPGYWELVGLEPRELQRLRDMSTGGKSDGAMNEGDARPVRRGWNPLRLFRRQGPAGSRK